MLAGAAPSVPVLRESAATFAALDLDPRLLRALVKIGYQGPTLIQEKALPLALAGKDLLIKARTGSGKSEVFCLPLLQRILALKEVPDAVARPEVSDGAGALLGLVFVPTRDLAAQVSRLLYRLSRYCHKEVSVLNLSKGPARSSTGSRTAAESQLVKAALSRDLSVLPDILVGTPSAVSDAVKSKLLSPQALGSLSMVVFDEADLLLSLGHLGALQALRPHIPPAAQHVLLSATLPPHTQDLKRLFAKSWVKAELKESENDATLTEWVYRVPLRAPSLADSSRAARGVDFEKALALLTLLRFRPFPFSGKVLIFAPSIPLAYKLSIFFGAFGISALVLNGHMPLKSRVRTVEEFNRGVSRVCIVAEPAAEGSVSQGEEDDAAGSESDEAVADCSTDELLKGIASEGGGGGEGDGQILPDPPGPRVTPAAEPAIPGRKRHRAQPSPAADHEFRASRGLDFQGVMVVVNFEVPPSYTSYVHRLGRTARGISKFGAALTMVPEVPKGTAPSGGGPQLVAAPPPASAVAEIERFAAIEARLRGTTGHMGWRSGRHTWAALGTLVHVFGFLSADSGRSIVAFSLPEALLDSLRYRGEDVDRRITQAHVRRARQESIKVEALASEGLRAHFEERPQDERFLYSRAAHFGAPSPWGGVRSRRGGGVATQGPIAREALDAGGGGGERSKGLRHLKRLPEYLLPSTSATKSITAANMDPLARPVSAGGSSSARLRSSKIAQARRLGGRRRQGVTRDLASFKKRRSDPLKV